MGKYYVFGKTNNDDVMSLYSKKPMDFSYKSDRTAGFKEIQKDFNFKFKRVKAITWQAHSDEVVIVDEDNVTKEIKAADGLLTNLKGIGLEIRTADCLSIFLYDPVKKVIGNVHSGWKGSQKQIVVKAVNKMVEHYGCNKEDIIACFNPSIMKCCFEVRDDVINLFKEICDVEKYSQKVGETYMFDLVSFNRDKLIELGIKEENIVLSNICTSCNTKDYHSYRKENNTDGRNLALICLK